MEQYPWLITSIWLSNGSSTWSDSRSGMDRLGMLSPVIFWLSLVARSYKPIHPCSRYISVIFAAWLFFDLIHLWHLFSYFSKYSILKDVLISHAPPKKSIKDRLTYSLTDIRPAWNVIKWRDKWIALKDNVFNNVFKTRCHQLWWFVFQSDDKIL